MLGVRGRVRGALAAQQAFERHWSGLSAETARGTSQTCRMAVGHVLSKLRGSVAGNVPCQRNFVQEAAGTANLDCPCRLIPPSLMSFERALPPIPTTTRC